MGVVEGSKMDCGLWGWSVIELGTFWQYPLEEPPWGGARVPKDIHHRGCKPKREDSSRTSRLRDTVAKFCPGAKAVDRTQTKPSLTSKRPDANETVTDIAT